MLHTKFFHTKFLIAIGIVFSLWSTITYALQIPVICYHNFRPFGSSRKLTLYELKATTFEQHLRWFKKQGYKTISLIQLRNYLSGKKMKLPHKPIILTFDDGWRSQYSVAYPLMKKYGFSGVMFLYPVVLSRKGRGAFMSHTQVRYLKRKGWEIGAHSYDHPLLHKLNAKKNRIKLLTTQFTTARKILERWYKTKIISIAYPNGVYLNEFLDLIKKNYLLGFTINRSFIVKTADPLKLPRYMMAKGYRLKTLKYLLCRPTNERPVTITPRDGGVFNGYFKLNFKNKLADNLFIVMHINGSGYCRGRTNDHKKFTFKSRKKPWRGMNNLSFFIQYKLKKRSKVDSVITSSFLKK